MQQNDLTSIENKQPLEYLLISCKLPVIFINIPFTNNNKTNLVDYLKQKKNLNILDLDICEENQNLHNYKIKYIDRK